MCGIAGILRVHEPGTPPPSHVDSIPDAWLDVLDDSIRHRGPDGAGRFRDRATRPDGTVVDVALVHRRLSIIDHEGGAQPMVHVRHPVGSGELLRPSSPCGMGFQPVTPQPPHHPDTTDLSSPRLLDDLTPPTLDATSLPPTTDLVAVAFNGCIYNHRELRTELEAAGHRFETDHADTEVLIHGWREWGLRMQDELDGMYAFLIWDRRTGQLAWGRDLAGEKPLYQAIDVQTRVFATTPCALARWHRIVDQTQCTASGNGIDLWIRDGAASIPAIPCFNETTATAHVTPREPRRGGTVRKPFRTDEFVIASHRLELPERHVWGWECTFAKRFAERVASAITSRLEADVPLGLFLSGGLDSALIAAIARQHRPDIAAFTVRMPDQIISSKKMGPHFDESEAAAETAAHLGLAHHILDCDSSHAADDLVMLIEQLGLPFGDSSLLPTYWVCRAARDHVTVALSGDGGDELFGGYRRHTINPALHRYRHLLHLIPDRLLDRRQPGSRTTSLARLAVAARHGGYSELLSIFPTPDLRSLLTIEDHGGDAFDPGMTYFQSVDDPLRHDFLNYLPDDLLRKTDTASMAVALEVRCPFLARDLVDAAMRTPLDVLMPSNERKGLLKQVARAYLPEHIVDRPKQGFAIPIGEWFRSDFGGLRQLLHDHLGSADPFPGLAEAGIEIHMSFVRKMLAQHDAAGEPSRNPWHGRDHSQRLYMLLVLSIWCRWLAGVRKGDLRDSRSA